MTRRDDYYIPESSGTGASPGFSWGRGGNTPSGTYLLNEGVPSNKTGRPIGLNNGRITGLVVSNENVSTFTIELEEHDGTTFTSLGTYTISSSRNDEFLSLNIPITTGKEMAVKVSSGSCKNPVVTVYVKGDAIA